MSEDVINLEQVFEERDESGVSLGLLRTSLSHRQNIGNIESLLNFLTTISDTDTDCLICSLGVEWSVCFHAFIHSVLPALHGSLPIVASPLVQSAVKVQTVEKSAHSSAMLHSCQALKTFVRNMGQRFASSSKRLFISTKSFQMTRS